MENKPPLRLRTDAQWNGPQLMPDEITVTLEVERGEKLLPLEVPLTISQAALLFEELEQILRRIGTIFPALTGGDHAA